MASGFQTDSGSIEKKTTAEIQNSPSFSVASVLSLVFSRYLHFTLLAVGLLLSMVIFISTFDRHVEDTSMLPLSIIASTFLICATAIFIARKSSTNKDTD